MIFVIEYGTDENPQLMIDIQLDSENVVLNTDAYKPLRAVFFCETMEEATEIVNNLREEYASNRN